MKTLLLAVICVLTLAVSAAAQPHVVWLRYPSLSPDGKTIVFTYKGDLYRVAATGGTAMLWFSTRDGLKSVAQSGSAQRDVYAMFFTKEAWDRFRLTKDEYALVKEAEEKKDKEKPKADAEKDKKDASKDAKIDDVVIDFDGLEIRKARLTIHSSLLGDALVGKDGETLYSDGHCYAYTYKMLEIGPLVGMPVPGTCTFAGWESLPDGVRWGVPGIGVKDSTTGKYLENQQTEPDIRLMNDYGVVITGKDQQLEAAVAELMKIVK